MSPDDPGAPAPSGPVLPTRRRGALAPTIATLGVLIALALGLASVWTDVLWFSQLGFTEVYRTRLLAESVLFLIVGVTTAAIILATMVVAYRSRPVYAPTLGDQASLTRYRAGIEPLRRLVALILPVGLGLFAGSAAGQQWDTALLWWNRVPFGQRDAHFDKDISFYVFTLPWLLFVIGLLSTVVFLAGLVAVVVHYLYGGLRLQGPPPHLTPAARMQLSVLAAAFLLLRGLDYWFGRYALTTKQSDLITGMTYTDAHATLNARSVLAAIATVLAVLFLVAAFVDRWRMLPLYGLVLMLVSAILVGGVYPAVVQRFRVTPSPAQFELPYVERNIDATRAAYGLDRIDAQRFAVQTDASPAEQRRSADAIPGIRLLDPARVSDTYKQLEQNKPYYQFADTLDVDRYTIKGVVRDSVVAVRELNLAGVPQDKRNWFNDHFLYTHGYGLVAAYGNEVTANGAPVFFESGIPVRSTLGAYEPRIYFGERSPAYSIVGGPADGPKRELDYPDDASPTQQVNTTYAGTGGVPMGSLLRRSLFALKFREQNILLSEGINDQSRIMYERHPRERVQQVAPYLTLDGDPYPSVVNGRIVWIIDGYTTTNRYPYSSPSQFASATRDSRRATPSDPTGQFTQINYIRNSVKATVDAYDGAVTLYAWDEDEPVLQTWRKIFPTSVKPLSAISAELMSHLRYPEDLFKVQRNMLTRYHVTDKATFFSGGDFWQVPPDPTAAASVATTTGQTGVAGSATATTTNQPPYYLSIQMPGQESPRYSLTSTFIPSQGGRNTLKGFLAVDADAGNAAGERRSDYGTLRLLQVPGDTVNGPGLMQNSFNTSPDVGSFLTLLRNGSSNPEFGNLLTLPIAGGVLYVEPVYVRGKNDATAPLMQKVLVGYGQKVGFASTLKEAFDQVFGASSAPSKPNQPTSPGGGTGPTTPAGQAALQQALADAQRALADGEAALAKGDFAAYGEAQKRLKDAIARAAQAQTGGGASPAPSGTPSASLPATPSPSP